MRRTDSKMSQASEKSDKTLSKSEKFLDELGLDEAARLRKLKKYNYFIILPDDSFKQKWNLIITCNLLFTAIITPYRIAFFDLDDSTWIVIDSFVDAIFGIDMVLNFFTAYYDSKEDIVDTRKKIAITYVRSSLLLINL